ncbi:hypothetical protein RO3G_03663 [Rhizopus delemar RA 99-880]|uniref:Zn(2)-C6 fungal-type domain-containing protein n=3 Tax=Rhizopus TaxID=4842 RepID=I1BRX8_RHIO9|nr:hypothetical protein RO3G_03663 [Rhizopus delemar RA 99-880]|eukprot:EIE78958.1 hypothetical protein RO3G_03663 [Rhizopus delemar RA 99-880]
MQSMPYYQQQGYQTPYQNTVLNNAPMLTHPNGLPPMQPGLSDPVTNASTTASPKRKQVKNACTNCQKACKKCDDARPCPRCIKYGIADTCVNSVRKERKKGIKRGPYKRRQKTEDKQNRKTEDSQTQYAPAMRNTTLPFGYPSNLNQYGQPYDPYNQYATYHKEQMMTQPYVVNPVYPPMGYPVLVTNSGDHQQQSQQHPYSYMIHHQPQQQQQQQQQQNNPVTIPTRPPVMQHQNEHYPTQPVYYQSHATTGSQRNSPHLPDVKSTAEQDGFPKQTMTTPIPSTSTSTATTSSPDSSSWVPPRP